MKTYIETTTKEKPLLEITYDETPESPRVWSNIGFMVCKMRKYYSPDKHAEFERILQEAYDAIDVVNVENHKNMVVKLIEEQTDEKVKFIYPISKYEHSGISFSIGESHGFDSGVVGFYIVTEKSLKEIGLEDETEENILCQIENEIETYNKYVNGEVYSFILYDEHGEIEDSCCGFYSFDEIKECLPEEWKDENLRDYLIY